MIGALRMQAFYKCDRLLACELMPEAIKDALGMIAPYHPKQ